MRRFLPLVLVCLMLVSLLSLTASATPTLTLQVGTDSTPHAADQPLPAPDAPEGKVFVGWAASGVLLPANAVYSGTEPVTLTALFVGMETEGEVRLGEKKGLRFLTEINKADLQALQAYTTLAYGTLIAPLSYVQAAGGVLTPAALAAAGKTKYLEAKADTFLAETDTVYVLSGSVVSLLAKNYKQSYCGAGYLQISYTNGQTAYVAATPSAAVTPYDTALSAHGDRTETADATHIHQIGDRYSPYTAEELRYFSNILSGCVDLSYWMSSKPITLEPADAYHQLPYTATFDNESESVVLTVTAGSDFRFDKHFCQLLLDGYLTSDGWNKLNLTVGEDGRTLAVKYREFTDLE